MNRFSELTLDKPLDLSEFRTDVPLDLEDILITSWIWRTWAAAKFQELTVDENLASGWLTNIWMCGAHTLNTHLGSRSKHVMSWNKGSKEFYFRNPHLTCLT